MLREEQRRPDDRPHTSSSGDGHNAGASISNLDVESLVCSKRCRSARRRNERRDAGHGCWEFERGDDRVALTTQRNQPLLPIIPTKMGRRVTLSDVRAGYVPSPIESVLVRDEVGGGMRAPQLKQSEVSKHERQAQHLVDAGLHARSAYRSREGLEGRSQFLSFAAMLSRADTAAVIRHRRVG